MSYTKEREEFIARATQEGLPVYVTRQILAKANTLQRIAELSCSSEAADRDRVPCPGVKNPHDCCCDSGHARCDCDAERLNAPFHSEQCATRQHQSVPRIDRQEHRIRKNLAVLIAKYPGFGFEHQGDPRGYVLKLKVPSRRPEDPIGVPSKGLPASYWEHAR